MLLFIKKILNINNRKNSDKNGIFQISSHDSILKEVHVKDPRPGFKTLST